MSESHSRLKLEVGEGASAEGAVAKSEAAQTGVLEEAAERARLLGESPAGQALLQAGAAFLVSRAEQDQRRAAAEHEYRMTLARQAHELNQELNRLYYEDQRMRFRAGVWVVGVGLGLIAVAACAVLFLMEKGYLSERVVANAGVVLAAFFAALRLGQSRTAPPAAPQPVAGQPPASP